jgi:hypothetical protein
MQNTMLPVWSEVLALQFRAAPPHAVRMFRDLVQNETGENVNKCTFDQNFHDDVTTAKQLRPSRSKITSQ